MIENLPGRYYKLDMMTVYKEHKELRGDVWVTNKLLNEIDSDKSKENSPSGKSYA